MSLDVPPLPLLNSNSYAAFNTQCSTVQCGFMKEEIVELIINGETVSARSRGMTVRSLLTSLGVSASLCLVYVLIFSTLRKKMRSIYEPRTFIVAKHLRIASTSDGFIDWIPATYRTPLQLIPQMVGLDAYFFLRYLLFVMCLCGAMALVMIPVLLPLHLTSSKEGVQGLDKLTISNISEKDSSRHVAHLVLCTISVIVSLYFFRGELLTYFRVRAEHLVSQNAPHSSSVLLIKGLHPEFMESEFSLRMFFDGLSSESNNTETVRHVWFNRDFSKLHQFVSEQFRILEKLERQELWLIQLCLGIGVKEPCPENGTDKYENITGSLWRKYLSDPDKALVDGYKGDALIALKSELSGLNSHITNMRANSDLFPKVNSCFVEFDSKLSCFTAARSMGTGSRITPGSEVFDHVYPADVIWSSLGTATWIENVYKVAAVFLNYLFVLGWAIPIALVAVFTQVEVMARWMPEVQWLVRIPRISQVMTSVVSPLLMSGLTSQVPTVFRALARVKGFPTNTLVEMDVQKYLFLFMFFQLFLIVTLATGLPSLLVKIMLNTSEGAITLASSLPKASTFFMSYLIASSLTTAGNALLQTQQLVLRAWDKYFSTTPRQRLRSMCRYSMLYWGSLFPLATNIAAIAIAYSLINPVILLSAVAGCGALFIAYKYRILYCYVPRCIADGDYYPRAIFQLFSGIYCQEISLLGTLLVSRQIALACTTSVLLVGTIIYHHELRRLYLDMNNRIPLRSSSRVFSDDLEAQIDTASLNSSSASTIREADSPASLPHGGGSVICSAPGSPANAGTLSEQIPTSGEEPAHLSPQAQSGATAAVQDTWLGIFDSLASDYNSLDIEQQQYIRKEMFQHPDCRDHRPCVWLPRDDKGVAEDQIIHMQYCLSDMKASCNGASIDAEGKITITLAPPDFEPREIMKI